MLGIMQAYQFVAAVYACYKYLSVRVDQSLHEHHAQGHNGLLQHGGDTHTGNSAGCICLKESKLFIRGSRFTFHILHPFDQNKEGDYSTQALRDQGRPGNTSHAHMEADHEQQIKPNVCKADTIRNLRGVLLSPRAL